MHKNTSKHGFTLVEASISMGIIAALLVGFTAVKNVQHNVDLKTVMDDITSISQSVQKFKTDLDSLPGDYWNAIVDLGAAHNGDGDNIIDGSEYLYFWEHLSVRGLIEGSYAGTSNTPGVGVMEGPFIGSGYYVYSDASGFTRIGIATYFDADVDGTIERLNTEDRRAVLIPKDAWSIDQRFDDGSPSSGYIRGLEAGGGATGVCISGADYDLDNARKACILEVILDQIYVSS